VEIKFRKPPIDELVIGVYFDREIDGLRTQHVGLFWQKFRKEFPTARQRPVTVPVGGGAPGQVEIEFLSSDDEIVPMPRFWFEAADGVTLIQLQKNAFLFNWRKREAEYPHFDVVKQGFDKNFALFTSFLSTELSVPMAPIAIAELMYVNKIEECEYWLRPEDTANVLPNFRLPTADKPAVGTLDFVQSTRQSYAHDLFLTTTVRSARSARDTRRPVLVFELRALGALGGVDKSAADEWFIRAHDTIGACFLAMTNPDIQARYWERV